MAFNSSQRYERPVSDMFERVVQVNRVSKKGKGGDKRSLSVLVVVGDKKGQVGVGLGKAADVQAAVAKATTRAKRHLVSVSLKDNRTIAHEVFIKLGAARIMIKPAPEGTGIIAGGAVRVVAEAVGIQDVVAKILGTKNKASNVHATMAAFKMLKTQPNTATKTEVATAVESKKPAKKTKVEKPTVVKAKKDKE